MSKPDAIRALGARHSLGSMAHSHVSKIKMQRKAEQRAPIPMTKLRIDSQEIPFRELSRTKWLSASYCFEAR